MFSKFAPARVLAAVLFVLFSLTFAVLKSGSSSHEQPVEGPALVPIIGATKSVAVVAGNADADADPGETLEYTVTISNTGPDPATGVVLNDTLQNITTLVGGSLAISPIAVNDTYASVGNVGITVPDGAGDLLANDTNPGGGGTLTILTPPTTSAQGGNVSINTTDGSFTYNPPAGYEGTDSFTYTLSNGSGLNDTATVNITVSGMIWFVNNNAGACPAAPCNGRLSSPFQTLAAFQALNNGAGNNPAISDNIFIYESGVAYVLGVTLLNGQRLIGQDAPVPNTLSSITGITPPAFSNALPAMIPGGATTNIQNAGGNAITLGAGNTLHGFTVSNSTTASILGNSFGTVTIDNVAIGTNGQALILNTGTIAGSGFSTINSTGGTNNVSLTNVLGTLTVGGGAISGATGTSFNVSGGTVAVSFAPNITQANNAAMVSVSGGHGTGTITFTGTLNATNGTGLQFDNADGTYNFNGTTTLNGGDAGIDILNGSTGTFSFGTGTSITRANNVAGAAFNLSGATASNANVTYSGSMTLGTATGNMINIDNHDAGTMTFQTGNLTKGSSTTQGISISNSNGGTVNINNPTVAITMTGGNAISLTSNTGGTMNFTPAAGGNGIDLTTTSGVGFNATGGGTLIVTGAGNTIASTTGTALNVDNTNIGASGLTFLSISANGATNGIFLNNTGTTAGTHGGLTVTGTGTTDGSGGTIQNTTTRGASLTSGRAMSLSNMNFTNAATTQSAANCANLGLGGNANLGCNAPIHLDTVNGATLTNLNINGSVQQGINGRSVTNFVLSDTVITGIGNGPDEDGIHFMTMLGTCSITNTSISGSSDDNLIVQNFSGTSTLTITNSQFNNAGGSGVLFGIRGTANSTINITGATTTTNNNFSGGIVADTFENSTMSLTVTDITSSGNNDQLSVSAGDNSNVDLNATGNTLSSVAAGDFVAVSLLGSAFDTGYTFDARIQNNTITTANGLTADGLVVFNAGGGVMNSVISGNTFNYAGTQRAILIQGGQDGVAQSNMTVTGNAINISLDGAGNAVAGMLAQVAVATPAPPPGSANSFLCLDMGGGTPALRNTFSHPLGGNMAAGDVRVRQRFDSEVRLPGYGGAASDNAAVVTYLTGRNTLVNVPTATATNDIGVDPGATGFVSSLGCTQPSPIPPPGEGNSDPEITVSRIGGNISSLFHTTPLVSFVDIAALEGEFAAKRALPDEMHVSPVISGGGLGIASAADNPGPSGPRFYSRVSEFAAALGEIISPTAHAQDKMRSEGQAPNAPESGETVTTPAPFTLPAGETITVRFRATVDNGPYASGVNNITNTAVISGSNFANVNSTTSLIALDAAPDLVVTKTEGGGTTQPAIPVVYTLSYSNPTASNGQNAASVVLTETVPANTTFNAANSTAGWSCPDLSVAGTVCTFSVGAVNAGAAANVNFAVNVLGALPAGVIQVSNTSSIAENPNVNGTDRNPANNTGPDTTNIIGNWLGGTSTDWFTAANWSNGVVPPVGNNVSIPNVANQPIVTTADVTLNNMNLIGENVTINAGRTVTVTGAVTLGANIVNGPGILALGTTGTITRTTGQVESTLVKSFTGPASFTYPVGTTGPQFSPLAVTVTAGAGDLAVRANAGTAPATTPLVDATTLDRYWSLTETGNLTADLLFTYLQADVDGNEGIYRVLKVSDAGLAQPFPNGSPCPGAGSPCVDPGTNTIRYNGVQVFSLWTAGEAAPTAADATINGRVLNRDGRGLYGAIVSIAEANGNVRYAMTNPLGYYRFINVRAGESYVVSVRDKRFEFASRVINLSEDVADVNFIPLE